MTRQFEYNFYRTLKQLERQIRLQPLNLGGVSSSGGGAGGPPGGFIGVLPQTRVAYDTDELATLAVPSGATLLDNLNHIRYELANMDHGGLLGLSDDEHPQYRNDSRADTWLASKQETYYPSGITVNKGTLDSGTYEDLGDVGNFVSISEVTETPGIQVDINYENVDLTPNLR